MKVSKSHLRIIGMTVAIILVIAVVTSIVSSGIIADTKKDVERYEEINRRIVDTVCPKCNGKMENGFIIDRGQKQSYTAAWVQGTPQVGANGVNSEPGSVVVTLRCKACGYLESYAK